MHGKESFPRDRNPKNIFFFKKREKKQKKSTTKRRTDKATEKEEEEDKEDKKEEENARECDKTHIFSSLYISRFIPLFFAVGVVVYNNITEERERD